MLSKNKILFASLFFVHSLFAGKPYETPPTPKKIVVPQPASKSLKVSLYDQVVARIREKLLAKVGKKTGKTRYFFIPFAYEDRTDQAEASHSFATFVRVDASERDPEVDHDYSDPTRNVEAFTISWLPERFDHDPTLVVWDPWISIFNAKWNKVRPEKGHVFTLKETLKFASDIHNYVGMWGPYEIRKEFFDIGVKRRYELKHGLFQKNNLKKLVIKYIADDRLYRASLEAINCFHAIANFDVKFPLGGFLDTGLKIWGVAGTKHNIEEYVSLDAKHAAAQKWFLGPVNKEADVFGFVYVSDPKAKLEYNPFKTSSAYSY